MPGEHSESIVHVPRPTRNEIALSDETIVDVVRELNSFHSKASLDTALGMGRIVVDRIYHGDLRSWRLHKAKEVSFRRLAAHCETDLRVSASTLYRAVALYELAQRFGVKCLAGLNMARIRTVLGLPKDRQAELLAAAGEKQWSAERMEREASRIRDTLGKRQGRPASPPLIKLLRHLLSAWKALEEQLNEGAEPDLSLDETQSFYVALDDVRIRVEKIVRGIARAWERPRILHGSASDDGAARSYAAVTRRRGRSA
jgi:hypothetical protein